MRLQHAGFLALCVLLTVPECTKCCRATEHRTLHSINARTAFYTMSVGALVKSCAKMLDCTQQPDGSYTLDAMPDIPCWEHSAWIHLYGLAPAGAVGLVFYCVLVPLTLFCALHRSAADGHWTPDELEKHAWLLLKVRALHSPIAILLLCLSTINVILFS